MSSLEKYSTFEELKSVEITVEKASLKENPVLAEFEAFMRSLQHQFSINQPLKEVNGKPIR